MQRSRSTSSSASAVMIATAMVIVSTACSLLVSTDNLSENELDAGVADGSTTSSSSGSADALASIDGQTTIPASEAGVDSSDPTLLHPSLIVAYSFEEQDGNVVRDLSGNGNNGVLNGSVSWSKSGVRGGAVQMHGLDTEFVEIPSLNDEAFPRSGTLSVWFKVGRLPDNDEYFGIFDAWDSTRHHLFLRHPNDAETPVRYQFALQPKVSSYSADFYFDVQTSVWKHIVFSWDQPQQEASLYIDGKYTETQEYGDPFLPTDQAALIGIHFAGEIDEFRLYKHALGLKDAEAIP